MPGQIYLVEYQWTDKEGNQGKTLGAFATHEKAGRHILRKARKLLGYDKEAEQECPNGPLEYACAKLGASISTLKIIY